jgi:hypothetical protein
MTRRLITSFVVVCALVVCTPAMAAAGGSGTAQQAISDCNNHDQLTQHYSTGVLRQALAKMPADVKEYTDCYDVIERQLLAQVGNSKSSTPAPSSSSSSSFLPTWLIVVIVLLILVAVTFGAISLRRRGAETPPGPGGPSEPPGAGGPGSTGAPGSDDPDDPGPTT